MMRLIIVLSLLACFSCKSDKAKESAFDPSFDNTIDISSTPKSTDGFSHFVASALKLDSIRGQKLIIILHTFEVARTGLPKNGRKVKMLVEEREAELSALLSSLEREQLRFIKLKYNSFPLKDPRQVTNIQKTVGMSDGEVLKYIEIVERFKQDGNKKQMDQRLKALLTDKYNLLIQAGTFYK